MQSVPELYHCRLLLSSIAAVYDVQWRNWTERNHDDAMLEV